jgi:putative oxidoreductase
MLTLFAPGKLFPVGSSHTALSTLRVVVSVLILIHGTARIALGIVDDFGGFLRGFGVPLAVTLAWVITIMEVVGSLLLGLGWWVRALALYFAAELLAGIALVHAAEGWFVVGAGRNGMEYSVLLIVVLMAVAYAAPGESPSNSKS